MKLLGKDCSGAQDLAALARTCRPFKEPALDELWRVLLDSSPLARCIPDASDYSPDTKVYSFRRPPTQMEWDVLKSYTRRIRSIESFDHGLDWLSVKTFLNPPTTHPLFPNLRILRYKHTEDITLLRLPLPSLVELSAVFLKSNLYPDFLKSLPETSPNIRRLCLYAGMHHEFNSLVSSCICRWQNLQYLACDKITLDRDAFMHLFRMPALAGLNVDLCNTSIPSDSPLVSPNLNDVVLQFESPKGILRLLHQAQFPAVTNFGAVILDFQVGDLFPLLAGLSTSNTTHTLETLRLETWGTNDANDPSYDIPFGFADLQPCRVFNDLRHLELDVQCPVDLTDNQILTLASAWPKLECLSINQRDGWQWNSGITPGGLIQLLQTCRSLSSICLLLNTQGYTEASADYVPASLGLTFPSLKTIHVIDSAVEEESVTAITTFFSAIVACTSTRLSLFHGPSDGQYDDDDYFDRWEEVESHLLSPETAV